MTHILSNSNHRKGLVPFKLSSSCSTNTSNFEGNTKSPLTIKNLRIIIAKFDEMGLFNVLSGRERKFVSFVGIQKVALQVKEDKLPKYMRLPVFVV